MKIQFDGQEIYYDVVYKNKKTMSMKVENGRVCVRAPYGVSFDYIEACLQRYAPRLIKMLSSKKYDCFFDGGYVTVFKERYEIVVRDVNQKRCLMHGKKLYVYSSKVEEVVNAYLSLYLKEYIEGRIADYLRTSFDLKMPIVKIKKYKSRWGSCYYQKGEVSFNLALIHLDKELIDFVIVHELCHFIEPNHSIKFYQEMDKRLLHHRQLRQRLKEESMG